LYGKIIEILDIVYKAPASYRNNDLNRCYVTMLEFADFLLEREDLREILKDKPNLFETVIGDFDDDRLEWEFLSKDAYNFYGKIEKMYILQGDSNLEIPKELEETLHNVDVAIENHKKMVGNFTNKVLKFAEEHGSKDFGRKQKIKLKDKQIKFNDTEATIEVGDLQCPLPAYKNEHFFCRIMFQYLPQEPVDWSIVYEKITKTEAINKEKNKRMVQDTMYALNKRVKEVINTDDDLFTWQERTIKRNY
jgi:hypothetical protein